MMFSSTLLAFGLSALALVRAAPAASFQAPMLSCSVELTSDIAPPSAESAFGAAFGDLESGVYQITNAAFGGQLRAYGANQPVVVGPPLNAPSTTAMWSVVSQGGNEYTISNFRSKAGTIVTSVGTIITVPGPGAAFAVSPAGDGTYTIQVPNEDEVWAVSDDPASAGRDTPVYLKPQNGGLETKWVFKRL
ncbi:hypothetical protein C8R45DRAFT_1072824 [Mycena sanguinolenta]|nr:hypothetical protein C8R45DRAFT_1072824 [Mycena sanguinolenta]